MEIRFGPDLTYFMWSLAGGVIVAIVYDLLRTVRRVLKASDLIVNFTDVIFLVLSGALAVVFAYIYNNGELRIYSLVCMMCAFWLYKMLVGDFIVGYTVNFLELIKAKTAKAVLKAVTSVKKVAKFIRKQ